MSEENGLPYLLEKLARDLRKITLVVTRHADRPNTYALQFGDLELRTSVRDQLKNIFDKQDIKEVRMRTKGEVYFLDIPPFIGEFIISDMSSIEYVNPTSTVSGKTNIVVGMIGTSSPSHGDRVIN